MNGEEFREALKLFMPENTFHRVNRCPRSPSKCGYGKSLIYQLLPKVLSSHWYRKTGEVKAMKIIVVSPLETLIRKQQCERLSAKRHQVGMHTRSHNLNCKNSRIHVSRLNIYNITILHVKANYFWILVMLYLFMTLRHNEQGAGWCASVTW